MNLNNVILQINIFSDQVKGNVQIILLDDDHHSHQVEQDISKHQTDHQQKPLKIFKAKMHP